MSATSVEKNNRKIIVFVILTFSLSSIFWFFADKSQNYYLFITGLMWCPGLSGIITSSIFKDPIGKFRFQWKNTKYIVFSYLLPIIYLSISYILLWFLGLGDIDHEQITNISAKLGISSSVIGVTSYIFLIALFGAGSRFFAAVGEEIGWRGFLLDRLLVKYRPLKASIFVGVIWAVWHYPLFGFPEAGSDFISGWLPIINFTIMVIALSVIYTKFWIVSGSIWTCFFLHTSHNLFLQSVFNSFTKWNDKTDLYADETGLLLMIILVITAIILARNMNKNPQTIL